jgi:hypothetical protein
MGTPSRLRLAAFRRSRSSLIPLVRTQVRRSAVSSVIPSLLGRSSGDDERFIGFGRLHCTYRLLRAMPSTRASRLLLIGLPQAHSVRASSTLYGLRDTARQSAGFFKAKKLFQGGGSK